MTSQTINLNLIPGGAEPVLNVSQYDKGQTWTFNIYAGGQTFSIPSGSSVTIRGTKPDRKGFAYNCTYSGSVVTAIEQLQMTAVPGKVPTEIVITKGTETIGSANFILMVERAALDDDTDISDSELSVFIDLARTNEENAEAWAVGTKAGTPVSQSDDQYHNNAKYYAESIGAYTNESEAWAVGKRGGQDVPSSDPTYHNNSKYYASQAGTSASTATTKASQASTSATNAANSASTATTKATAASNSASNAAQSASDAANSAELAAQYADYVVPHFIIQDNRLYLKNDSTVSFVVADNRLYMKLAG